MERESGAPVSAAPWPLFTIADAAFCFPQNGTKGQRTRPPSSKRGNKLVVHERPAYGQKKRRSRG